jgi:hypothetical protein
MAAARCKAGLIVLGLLAAASGFLQLTAPPALEEAAAAWLVLPDTVNDCAGSAVRFCQNEACGRRVVGGSADERCAACGGPLGDLAPAETKLLPAGTRILRRLYAPPGGLPFTVTVVFGDRERRSIHRPQVCLVGQGYAITDERVLGVPLPGRAPLPVTLLNVTRRRPADDAGAASEQTATAYWFVNSKGQETPRHFTRLWWTAWDGVVRNERPRWAYVMAADAARGTSDRLLRFIAALYPHLRPPPAPSAAE